MKQNQRQDVHTNMSPHKTYPCFHEKRKEKKNQKEKKHPMGKLPLGLVAGNLFAEASP